MTNKTSGRAAFTILAIALLVGFAGPTWAADTQPDPAFPPVTSAATPSAPADAQAQPASPAPSADQQLSDTDRAAHQDDVREPVIVTQQNGASAAPSAPAAHPVVVAGSQNATWDETSLIGKIFIGFGALLTIASAARMFMA
jgi:hypothetical protein